MKDDLRRWFLDKMTELSALHEHPEPHESVWERCTAIATEAGDLCARHGLSDLHARSIKFPALMEPMQAKTFLSDCLAACPESKPENGSVDCKQAAQALGVSERVIRDLIASGELGSHRVGNGRGQIRITPRDLEDYRGRDRPTLRHL